MKKVIEKRKDIAFYIKLYPLVSIHPSAYEKSKTILCKKSLKLLEDAYEGKQLPKPTCEAKEIDENIKLASEFGISGTPTIIMPNGKVFIGFRNAEQLIGLIDSNNN
jgi:thiol:disulfide interchange protein DsbC